MKRIYILCAVALLLLGVTSSAGVIEIPSAEASGMSLVVASGSTPDGGDGNTASYVSSSYANDDDEDNSITVTAPTGISDGDLIVAFVAEESEGSPACTGFTEIDNQGDAIHHGTMFYKIASSESGDYTWTGAYVDATVHMIVITKTGGTFTAPTTAGYYSGAYETSSTGVSATITTLDGSVLIAGFSIDTNFNVTTGASGMTGINKIDDDSMSGVIYYQKIVTGSEVSKNLVWSGSSRNTAILVVCHAE